MVMAGDNIINGQMILAGREMLLAMDVMPVGRCEASVLQDGGGHARMLRREFDDECGCRVTEEMR